MKKILLAAGAAFGIYMIAKKLNAKKGNGIGNNLAVDKIANGGIIANAEFATDGINDEGNFTNNEQLTDENDDKEILEDGGNELGGTGGSVKNSAGNEHL